MGECNLDWKKVFKQILSPPQESVSHEEYKQESNIVLSDSDLKIKNEKLSDSITNYSYKSCEKIQKTPSVAKGSYSKQFSSRTCIELQKNKSNCCESSEVPNWNTTFKGILGNNSTQHTQEKKDVECSFKKLSNSKKQNGPAKKYNKEKLPHSNFKMDEEEKQVREMFAKSCVLKAESSFTNLNELSGCGVDISKCDKELLSYLLEEKSEKEPKLHSGTCNDYSKDDDYSIVPVKGLVANIKPLTRADILPPIPITEAWDDDLLI